MTLDSSIVTAALIPVLLFLLYKPLLRLLTPYGISGIPAYPDPAPLLGDLLRLTRVIEKEHGFGAFIDQVAHDLGPLAQVRFGFFRSMVVLTDYASAEYLLTKQHSHLERSFVTAELFQGLIPTGQIVIPTNDMWKHHRRLIGTSMTSKYLSLTTPRANEAVHDLIDLWKAKGSKANGRTWQADKDVESATMDAICGIAFGGNWGILKSYKSQVEGSNPEVGSVDEALFPITPPEMLESVAYLFHSIPTDAILPKVTAFITSLSPTWRRHQRKISAYLDQKLAEARSRAKEMGAETAVEMADNTLDLMVARELKGDDWMPNSEMKDELLQYLVAGTETSGTTLSWWVKYMTNHPEVQIKLRKHVLERLPDIRDRQPTFEEMNATTLPYLEAIVHESLRLSKTAAVFLREVIEDVVVLGTHLSKGTHIVFSNATGWEDSSNPIYASRLASDVPSQASQKPDAVKRNQEWDTLRADGAARKVGFWAAGTGKDFIPERWLDSEGVFNANAGPSMPFALGQRSCFGKNLALLEMRLFMCQLNQAFFFAPIAENQNLSGSYETITRHPRQCFVKPMSWDSTEARAAGA